MRLGRANKMANHFHMKLLWGIILFVTIIGMAGCRQAPPEETPVVPTEISQDISETPTSESATEPVEASPTPEIELPQEGGLTFAAYQAPPVEAVPSISQEPIAADVAANETDEPAPEPDAAADQCDEPTHDVSQEPLSTAPEPDAAADQRDELTCDVGQGPLPTEVAANETEERAPEPDAAAEKTVDTASESAEAVSPSQPGQAPNLNPLFVALAVGTALTAAATLNASANWARLLKNVAEGKSSTDGNKAENGEGQAGAGGDPGSGGD